MNYTERAKQLGFSAAAVMDTKNLVFKPEYRVFCEENRCGNYDRNPACPPESGSVEEMKEKALSYNKTLVLQTTQSNDMDYKKAKLVHNRLTESLAEEMKKDGKSDLLIMTAGPYRHHSCMSAYCVDAQKMADAAGMLCWTDDGNIRYSNPGKPSEAFREAALADSLESTPCHLDVSRGKWHRRTTGSLPDTIARKSSDTAYKQKSSDIMAK